MSYISKNIVGNDERIIYLAHLHWIYNFMGVFWLIFLSVSGYFVSLGFENIFVGSSPYIFNIVIGGLYITKISQIIIAVFVILGLFMFLSYFIKYISTEVAVTSERVISKKGLIMVEVEEIDISEIRSEHLNHGIFGRIFGYGRIYLDSKFVGDLKLPSLNRPYRFLRALHKSKSMIEEKTI